MILGKFIKLHNVTGAQWTIYEAGGESRDLKVTQGCSNIDLVGDINYSQDQSQSPLLNYSYFTALYC